MTKTVSFTISGINKQIDDVISAATSPLTLSAIATEVKKVSPNSNDGDVGRALGELTRIGYLKATTTYAKA